MGQRNDRGIWHIRYDSEIYNLYKEPDVITVVKANRLRWLGHLFRADDNNPCKKVTFNDPFYVKRKVGRPATWWLDDVENNLKLLKKANGKGKPRKGINGRRSLGRSWPKQTAAPKKKKTYLLQLYPSYLSVLMFCILEARQRPLTSANLRNKETFFVAHHTVAF